MIAILRKAATSLLLITLVAFAARAIFALYEARQIPPEVLRIIPFQTEAGHIAYSLASGSGFSSPFQRDSGPTAWLTPVYPLLLAAIFKFLGVYTLRSLFVAVLFNTLFSAATCIPIYYAGQRIAGTGVAALAAWLWALFPNAVIIPFEWIWDTCLSALLAATLLWLTFVLAESLRIRDWCLYGLLWGFALLTNPALALLLPILLPWAAWRSPARARARLINPLLAATIAILCCVPWTVRNYVQFHRLIPLRSNFAFELYIGNNENYDEAHSFRPGAVTQDREILRYLRMGETAFMDEERRKAFAFIRANPRIELRLIALRFVEFWMGTPTPIITFREAPSLLLRTLLLCNYFAPFGALLGIVELVLKKSPYAIPLIALPLVFPLLYYITHTSLRYRHPIDPVVLLLTAIAICGMRRLARAEQNESGAASLTANSSGSTPITPPV